MRLQWIWIARCLFLTVLTASVSSWPGCSTTESTNIKTSGIWAQYTIEQTGDGDVDVEALLRVGGSNGTMVDLAHGEHLEVNGRTMSEYYDPITGYRWITATIRPYPSNSYDIVFVRVEDDNVSTVLTMPDKPYSDQVGNVLTGDAVNVFWDDPDTGGSVQIEVTGSCIVNQSAGVESHDGQWTTDPIMDQSAPARTCPFNITFTRHVQGSVNPLFQGGRTEATRHSTITLTFESTLVCGDGIREGPETCEATDLNGMACEDLGFPGGLVTCTDECRYDFSFCSDFECENRLDDNANGFIDCDDASCLGKMGCPLEACGDGIDNDDNGMTDCDDVQCAGNAPYCNGGLTWTENYFFGRCANGIDDDGDGLTDLNDPDCQSGDAILLVYDINGGMVQPGDQLLYSLTVYADSQDMNDGMVEATLDPLLAEVVPLHGGTFDPGTRRVSWSLDPILQGASVTLHLLAKVDPAAPDQSQICTRADLGFTGMTAMATDDPNLEGANDPTCVTVHQ